MTDIASARSGVANAGRDYFRTENVMPTDDIEQRALAETTERIGLINGLLRKTAADHINIGRALDQLHKSLRQGWKARIYSDSDGPLPGIEPLDITQADGEQLIRIARNTALAD